MAETPARLRVEVVYALIGKVWSRTLELPAPATVEQAVLASGFAREHPEVDVGENDLGVFGRRVPPSHDLRDGDRVEIYRPLGLDPMEARRRRARARV